LSFGFVEVVFGRMRCGVEAYPEEVKVVGPAGPVTINGHPPSPSPSFLPSSEDVFPIFEPEFKGK
jgi:hypothetical protein